MAAFQLLIWSGAPGKRLPVVESRNLKFDKLLGSGSYSKVSREILFDHSVPDWEPYYVAVKRIPVGLQALDHKIRCEAFARELRVTSHRNLKGHAFITPAIAYGWDQSYLGLLQPFLITEYSDHGTVMHYLKRFDPSIRERCDFVLDIARDCKAFTNARLFMAILPRVTLSLATASLRTELRKLDLLISAHPYF